MNLPQYAFNDDPISVSEISNVIKCANSSSSPSPIDRISYKIFKKCLALLPALIDLYNACWETQSVPQSWKQGVIRLIAKKSAFEDPSEPGNFRPIALTSCIGKVFTSILKDRWLNYMVANGYLDTNIHKAFIKNVPGCLEQYRKLLAAVTEAFKRHKSIAVCWLDLANAYGSINHGLIKFTLQHFYATPRFQNTVAQLYNNLNVVVSTPSWVTSPIPLRVGVYQGDPLSVVIFNSVMSTLGESLKQFQQLGYSFSNSPRTLITLQYADDTCLVADGPSSCQKLLQHMERWLEWTGMKAKVPKCHSLAIQATSGRPYDPKLVLHGASIPFIENKPIKFLGAFIQVPLDPHRVRDNVKSRLLTLLEGVDSTPVTRNQKLLLYKAGICPRLIWDLGISEVPISWVTKCLEATATRFLKKWSGLSRPADPSRIYLPWRNGGLDLPNISTLYRKIRASIACQLLTSRDPITRQVTKIEVHKEESQKRAVFKPMLTAREVMANDPGTRRRILMKRTKNIVETIDVEVKLDHAKSLAKQGQ